MLEIALRSKPHAACLVPERREERTTEGGLDAAGQHNQLAPFISKLRDAGIRVSLFIGADPRQIDSAMRLKAPVIEIHTGAWCDALAEGRKETADNEWRRIVAAVEQAKDIGLEVHAGHGLNYETAEQISALPQIAELNIGHFLIGEAVFEGLAQTVQTMRTVMERGRSRARP
jgi:pyridoxine 5-phosphate synthase